MSSVTVGYLSAILLIAALALGVHVAVAMAAIGIAGMWLAVGPALTFSQLQSVPFAVVNNYDFAVLPLFVLMGVLAEVSGVTKELFYVADLWLRRLKGGLYQAVVVGSALFAAISGSTIVNAVVFTRIAYPEMIKYGYSRSLSIGCIAATGSFAAMIPPSITMVIFAIMTDQSVGRLLIAGILPGILTAAIYMIGVWGIVTLKPSLAPKITEGIDKRRRWQMTVKIWPMLMLVVVIMGGLYAGIFPASAAGAAGAFGAFCIAVWRKRQSLGWLPKVLEDAAAISCVIFLILIGGLILSRMLVVVGVIDHITAQITSIATTPLRFMILTCLLYLVLGCFLDTTSMMVVTLPFLFPVTAALKMDPIWFGIIIVKLVEISTVTPPVGVNLFAVLGAAGKDTDIQQVSMGVLPFIAFEIVVLALLVLFPEITLWLPSLMMGK
jgi:tripartite ATP-independent transporter DctM subunit